MLAAGSTTRAAETALTRSNEELFAAAAEALSARIAALVHRRGGGARHTTRSRHVSSDRRDWGRLWTAAPDTSIAPSPSAESRATTTPRSRSKS